MAIQENPFGGGPRGGAATATKAPAKAPAKAPPRPPAKASPASKAKAAEQEEEGTGPVGIGDDADPFGLPSGGGSDYKFAELTGELLLINPYELDPEFKTRQGTGPMIRCNIVRLENECEFVEDIMVFQQAMIRELKKAMRKGQKWVLGRLGRAADKGDGRSPAYILDDPTAEEIAYAREVHATMGLAQRAG